MLNWPFAPDAAKVLVRLPILKAQCFKGLLGVRKGFSAYSDFSIGMEAEDQIVPW